MNVNTDSKNRVDPIKQLNEIHKMMEGSSKLLSLSGLSGIWAGVSALLGAFVAYQYFGGEYEYYKYQDLALNNDGSLNSRFAVKMILLALCTLFMALLGAWFFTARKARRMGETAWSGLTRKIIGEMLVAILAGAALCIILMQQNLSYTIPSLTLIFYGLALFMASRYTFGELRYLAFAEIILGLIAAAYLGSGLLFWAIGFGVFHIIYGALMYVRHK